MAPTPLLSHTPFIGLERQLCLFLLTTYNSFCNMCGLTAKKTSQCYISLISEDLLSEIFKRLPFKHITRSKCVSKQWLGLLSTHSFICQCMAHEQSLIDAIVVFLSAHELMLTFPPSPFNDELCHLPTMTLHDTQHKTLRSPELFIKGHVCGCSENLFMCSDNWYTSGQGYFICDPLTKEFLQVPPLPNRNVCLHAVGFICDPLYTREQDRKSWTTLDHKKCFRVVIIRSFIKRHYEFDLDVWSSETGSWIQITVRLRDGFAFAPHWSLSFAYKGSLYFMGRSGIFVFDPYDFDCDNIDYPQDSDPMNIMSFGFLGSCCGELRIADIGHNDVRVWELQDDEHWELVHHVNFSTNLPTEFCSNYYKRVGGFHPHDGDLIYLCSYADGMFVGNLKTKKFIPIQGYEKCDLSPFHLELSF